MPKETISNETQLCVVIDPPNDLFERAEKHGIDIDQVIIRLTRPRKIIARLPVQLLAGLEIVDDPQIIQEEIDDAVAALKSST